MHTAFFLVWQQKQDKNSYKEGEGVGAPSLECKMLSPKNRATYKDIQSLKVEGKRIHSQSLSFLYKKLTQEDDPKISCSVSKKVERLAVKRNRIKRQCREAVRMELASIKVPVLGVISFKKSKEGVSYENLLEEVREIFSNIT